MLREMADSRRNIVICSCEDTMPLDESRYPQRLPRCQVTTAHHLCRAEIDRFRAMARRCGAADRRLHAGISAFR